MLSNHETRDRMRCKLVENLQFDPHFEASRLRDYSGYTNYSNYEAVMEGANNDASNISEQQATTQNTVVKPLNDKKEAESLTQKLQINKEAINKQLNEDVIGDEEFPNQEPQQENLEQSRENDDEKSNTPMPSDVESNKRSSSPEPSIASSSAYSSEVSNRVGFIAYQPPPPLQKK